MQILKIIESSSEKLITLKDAKAHLRVTHNYEDSLIESLIEVCTQVVENQIKGIILNSKYSLTITDNLQSIIHFPTNSVYEIISVKKFDENDNETVLTNFTFSDEFISIKDSISGSKKLVIEFKTGYQNVKDVPESLKMAVKLLLSDYYFNRGTIVIGRTPAIVPKTIDRLLEPYINKYFA